MRAPERIATTTDQKESGRQLVLDTIRAAGQIARIDIAQATGLSPATVTACTTELLAANLVEEVVPENSARSGRGRPRVMLKVNTDAHRVAGLKISNKAIAVMIADYLGEEVQFNEVPLEASPQTPYALAKAIMSAVRDTTELAGLTVEDLSEIAVGMAGLIDAETGFVHWSPSLTTRNVNFGQVLAELSPCPALIANDANTVAKAEHLFGKGRDVRDFLVVTIEHGVGMGIVLDGKLYGGANGCGAEFGHTKVQLEGALCQCGQRGCLEAYVSDYALLREARVGSNEADFKDVAQIFEAAKSGDEIAQAVLDRSGRYFAMGLANLVNVFDPELIILSGAQVSLHHLLEGKIIEDMRRHVFRVDRERAKIIVHHWGDRMWTKGAAAYAIEDVSRRAIKEMSGA